MVTHHAKQVELSTGSKQAGLNKRLLHITRSMAPAVGGPAEGIRKLVYAAGQPSGVEVVCLDDPAAEFLRTETVPVHALGPGRGHYGYTPRLQPWLRENLARFDGVVLHGLWQYHSYGSYRVLRNRVPYAIFPHGMLDPYFKQAFPLKHLKKQLYWLAREHRVLRDARAVCFTTPIERDCSAATMWPYRAAPAVVSFGTTAPTGDPDLARAAFLTRFPALAGRRFFLFLSRIHAKKGCDLAIEAFARIAATQPDLDLVIAGPDEEELRPTLEAQAAALKVADRVHWTGMIEGAVKWGAVYAAEAFVLPSHQENFGVAPVEALAARLPILISNKVNIWPDVLADEAGIVDADTADGTYRSMIAFLKMSTGERLRMQENGLRCFQSRYEITRTAQALNDLF
ncbi:MAG TPA: glycosyltransferase [Acidobacteriaceae bacterium]|jgi:glycosyltransferase involved in cell wall biosynthesis|nr:glycosyltransferase [Acidobacteriaceae bacterium]